MSKKEVNKGQKIKEGEIGKVEEIKKGESIWMTGSYCGGDNERT